MRATVVGGGLAGLAAALDLVDAGWDVTVLEARPTLGGAVQTLPEREGDPSPPPDNGQHIALGCFTEYLRFLAEIGEGASYRRQPLALSVIGEDGSKATIKPSLPALLPPPPPDTRPPCCAGFFPKSPPFPRGAGRGRMYPRPPPRAARPGGGGLEGDDQAGPPGPRGLRAPADTRSAAGSRRGPAGSA